MASFNKPFLQAEDLLRHLGVTKPEDIDLQAIAFYQGVDVAYRPLSGCDAQIIGSGERAVITVNTAIHRARWPFSTAHELGHWNRHRHQRLQCHLNGEHGHSGKGYERTADRFAADLLMPRFLFVPAARQLRRTCIASAEALAEMFGTSLTSALVRLVEHGPQPSMLICHEASLYGGRSRKWFNPGQVESVFPRNELDPRSNAVTVLHGKARKAPRASIPASAWFEGHNHSSNLVYEESVQVTDGQVLTLVSFEK